MIVVIGQPRLSTSPNGQVMDGLAARISLAAAGLGRSVQLVGKVGEDEAGDSVVQALAREGSVMRRSCAIPASRRRR